MSRAYGQPQNVSLKYPPQFSLACKTPENRCSAAIKKKKERKKKEKGNKNNPSQLFKLELHRADGR